MAKTPKFQSVAELNAFMAQLEEQRAELMARSDREIGELVRKNGLSEMPRDVLYGAFDYLAEILRTKPEFHEQFAQRGSALRGAKRGTSASGPDQKPAGEQPGASGQGENG